MKKLFAGFFMISILLLTGFLTGCGSSGGSSADQVPPKVLIAFPLDKAVNVPINTKVTASFDMKMKAASITAESFSVSGADGKAIAGKATLAPDGLSAIYIPTANLKANTVYTAKLTTDVAELSGTGLEKVYKWSFTTGATPDTTAPTVLSMVPLNGAIGVAFDTNITAAFSEPMDPLTIKVTTITLKKGSLAIGGVVTAPLTTTMTFNPIADLDPDTLYTATITTGVKDLAGNALATAKTWTFRTRVLSAKGPAPLDLGLAGTYAILAETAISTVPPSVVTGDMGISPAAATDITGFVLDHPVNGPYSTSTQVVGKVYAALPDYAAPTPANLTIAVANRQTAYEAARDLILPAPQVDLYGGNLSGKTLPPGLYKWGTDVLINDNLTLEGSDNDVWVFQISQNVTMAADKSVILSGTALPKHVYWQVAGGTGVSVGARSHFVGIIMAATEINMGTGSVIVGRLLSHTAVHLQSSTVTQPAP